jgi:drug/metabolite transporter (DMT)-like permease
MNNHGPPTPVPAAPKPPPWYRNAYLQLALNGLLVTVSELLLKVGATETAKSAVPNWLSWTGITTLGSWWVWGGIACYIVSFINWLHILRRVPLSIAFPLTSVVHVLIPLGSWIFLGETVSALRWGGIALILAGIWLMAGAIEHAEEVT